MFSASPFPMMMLAFESGNVVGLRLMKMAGGGQGAVDESFLMISEKVTAAFEAHATLMQGGTGETVVARYRAHVAANADRLSRRPLP